MQHSHPSDAERAASRRPASCVPQSPAREAARGNGLQPLRAPHDVDALFRDMDALVREEADRAEGVRRRGRRALEEAETALASALRFNDARQPMLAAVRRSALELAVRDILAGRADRRAPCLEVAPPEPDAVERLRRALAGAEPPKEYFLVLEAMNDKVSNAARVAEAVSRDAALAALLLRLVNSPFYGLGSQVDSLQRAVAFTGFNELSALALSLAAARSFGAEGEEQAVPAGFWRRAILCGVLAKLLARRAGIAGEWFFVAGLLHDVGGLIARRAAPLAFARLEREARSGPERPEEVARRLLGLATPEIGARLLRRWGMDEGLAGLVELRREPGRAGYEPGICVLHVAEVLAAALTACLPETPVVPRLDPLAWDALGMAPAEVPGLLEQATSEASGVLGALLP